MKIYHYTINTDHNIMSHRKGIFDETIEALTPFVKNKGGNLGTIHPIFKNIDIKIDKIKSAYVIDIFENKELKISCLLDTGSDFVARDEWIDLYNITIKDSGIYRIKEPILFVNLFGGNKFLFETMADFERCIAFAIIECENL